MNFLSLATPPSIINENYACIQILTVSTQLLGPIGIQNIRYPFTALSNIFLAVSESPIYLIFDGFTTLTVDGSLLNLPHLLLY
jgi:hypothetical protein